MVSEVLNRFSFFRRIEMDIEKQGFHLVAIKSSNGNLLYAYTVGFYSLNQPEIIFMNSRVDMIMEFLETIKNEFGARTRMESSMLLKYRNAIYTTSPIEDFQARILMKHAVNHYNMKASELKLEVIVATSHKGSAN